MGGERRESARGGPVPRSTLSPTKVQTHPQTPDLPAFADTELRRLTGPSVSLRLRLRGRLSPHNLPPEFGRYQPPRCRCLAWPVYGGSRESATRRPRPAAGGEGQAGRTVPSPAEPGEQAGTPGREVQGGAEGEGPGAPGRQGRRVAQPAGLVTRQLNRAAGKRARSASAQGRGKGGRATRSRPG